MLNFLLWWIKKFRVDEFAKEIIKSRVITKYENLIKSSELKNFAIIKKNIARDEAFIKNKKYSVTDFVLFIK